MGKGPNNWGLTEDELDRLQDAVEDGILSTKVKFWLIVKT